MYQIRRATVCITEQYQYKGISKKNEKSLP